MKAVKRKALALLLAVTFLFGAPPAGALAEDAQTPETPVFDSDLSTEPVTYYKGTYHVTPLSVSASVEDGGKLTYQWYSGKDPGNVATKIGSGATSDSYTPPVKDSGTTYYQVTVTNTLDEQTAEVKSAVAEVVVLPAPTVTAEIEAADGTTIPADGYSYRAGETATTLKVVASCTDSDGNPVAGGTWKYTWYMADPKGPTNAPGSKSVETYTPRTTRDGKFQFDCFVQYEMAGGEYYALTSEVPVVVTATSAEAPTISDQPADATYLTSPHDIVALNVSARVSDGGKLTYQWYRSTDNKNFSSIDGATSASYKPATSSVAAVFYYDCVVTNTLNSVSGDTYTAAAKSETATVTFESIPGATWQGDGTESSPFLLSTADDLTLLKNLVNTQGLPLYGFYFKLDHDITLPQDWIPIGALQAGASGGGNGKYILPFSGTIDGGGHTLAVPEGGLPLFGYVRYATVKNLNIYGRQIAGYGLVNNYCVDYGPTGSYGDWTSGAAYPDMPLTVSIDNVTLKSGSSTLKSGFIGGYASGADTVEISNSTVEKGVTIGYDGTQSGIGSFAGAFNGMVENCVSSATVRGKGSVGGLIGAKGQSMGNCSLWDSAFHGTVSASGNYAGGLIGSGYNAASAPNTPCVTIQNCYADGSVSGADYVGGLFGGEPSCKQCWANGIGYIQNNYFSGTVSAGVHAARANTASVGKNGIKTFAAEETDDGGTHVGGVVGGMKSLDRYNVISNNYYLETCGANAGIGAVDAVAKVPASQSAAASSQSTNAAVIRQSAKAFAAPSTTGNAQYGRSDDPTGADADSLAAPATAEQLKDGSVLSKLNGGINSSGTWVKGNNDYPAMDTGKTHLVFLTATGYSKTYEGGSSLSSMSVFAAYSDGSTASVPQSKVRFSGFNSNTNGYETVTAKYQNHAFLFEVEIIDAADTPSANPVTVSLRLIGATKSNGPVDLKNGDYKGSRYVTWIPTKSYTLPCNSKVSDLLKKAFGDAGITAAGADSDYISAVYAPDVCGAYRLAADTNGPRSGWMCTIDGSHSVESIREQPLENGDAVVFHYVDDYSYEVADWFSTPDYPRLGDGTYFDEWLTAGDTDPAGYQWVTAFSSLGAAVKTRSVANNTPWDSLDLPASLKATVNGKTETISGVTWFSAPEYDPSADGTYTLTAVLPDGYESLTALPTITVKVAAAADGTTASVPATGAKSTVTTVSAPNDGTISTVTTQPDSAPVVAGNQSSVSVTVPSEISSILASATAQKPAEIRIAAPDSVLIGQINSSAVKSVALTIKVPAAVANNTNANGKITIGADASVLKTAKDAKKDLVIRVADADTGREAYSWSFAGSGLADSPVSVTNVNLALNVEPASKDPTAAAVTASNTADKKAAGVLLSFADNGLLPAPASVRIYVGDQTGCGPNSKVYLYYLNDALKALEPMPAGERTVDADGCVTVAISHCSDYVLLPHAATNPYPVKSDTVYPLSVKQGGSYTFTMTAGGGAAPVFSVGNGKAFASSVKRSGTGYSFTVKAIGAPTPGIATAVYCALPKQKPTVLCYLAIK